MTTVCRHQLVLLLIAGFVFFTNLGGYALFDEDEPKNAVCGRELFERGDWSVPTFNAQLRTDKPVLIYWLMQISFHLFGVSEFSSRLGSSLLAVGTTLLTYHLGRKLYSPPVGLLAGIILCTSVMFSAVGRSVTPDSVLIFCLTLAFTIYVWTVAQQRGGQFSGISANQEVKRLADLLPKTWLASLAMYSAMGLAILAKGPIGVLLPCTIIGLLLLISQREIELTEGRIFATVGPWWRRSLGSVTQVLRLSRIIEAASAMRVLFGAVVVLTIALPWYLAVGWQTDGVWLQGFLGDHNLARFLKAKEHHSGPVFYYVIAIFWGSLPWSVFLPLSLWTLKNRLEKTNIDHHSDCFVACWAGVWFAFFSYSSTKLPNYVLPMYPALALLTARTLHAWQMSSASQGMISFRHSCRGLSAIGMLLMVSIPIASSFLLPGEEWLLLIGAIPVMGGAFAYAAAERERRSQAIGILSVSAVALAISITGIGLAYVGSHQDSPKLAAAARQAAGTMEVQLAAINYFSPNLVFYWKHPVQRLRNPKEMTQFFNENPRGFVVTRSDKLEMLGEQLSSLAEVARHRRFLGNYDLVLLRRSTSVALHNSSTTD